MGSLGLPEIAFIFILALLIFGPKKLPEIGRTVGRGVAEFRKATNELKRSINTELALDETPIPPALHARRFEDPFEAHREAVAPPAEPVTPAPPAPAETAAPEAAAVPPADSSAVEPR